MSFVLRNARTVAEKALRAYERARAARLPGGVIIMYHRIASPASDPWGLSVSAENFAAQMDVLAERGQARGVTRFAEGLGSADQAERSVVLTFDDGYLDNLRTALPILEARGIPAVIYVMSGAVGDPKAYWWDFLARLFLETQALPETLSLDVGGAPKVWRLGDAAQIDATALAACARWTYRDKAGPRTRIFLEVWEHLVQLDPAVRRGVVEQLEAWSGQSAIPDEATLSRPVSETELRELAGSDLFEIGGHTVSHPDLSRIDAERAGREIAQGRGMLREMTGRALESFAYPFGRYVPKTVPLVAQAGFSNAVTTTYGKANPRSGLLEMPRLEARDVPGPEFEKILAGVIGPAPAA